MTAELAGPTAAARGKAGVEAVFAEVLAEVLRVERVEPGSHFFEDLGADSLVMAHFCARVRRRADLPPVSMKDVYRHPTIAGLAAALGAPAPPAAPAPAAAPASATEEAEERAPAKPQAQAHAHVLFGSLQLLCLFAYSVAAGLLVTRGLEWISAGAGVVDIYLRSVVFGGVAFLGLCAVPIAAKWTLIGRWKPQRIRLWSLAHLRFWFVAVLVRRNPLVLFIATPIYPLYLRALGARVGPGVAIFSRHVPVCTDLLTIGAGSVIRDDASFRCYRARAGYLETGPVTLGRDAFVGDAAVMDINTSLGDGAQLAHASSLHEGQSVSDGERWHGSPGEPTDVDYRMTGSARCGLARRVGYSVLQLLKVLAVQLPVLTSVVVLLLTEVPRLAALFGAGPLALTDWTFYRDAVVVSFVLFFGFAIAGLLFVATVPRLLHLAITPGRVYPLYGLRYATHRAVSRLTNLPFYTYVFGDSAAIVHYFRAVGYDLWPVEQTGSNFGLEARHEDPFLSFVGTGTMAADGLALLNADFTSTSFRVSPVVIGRHNFIGNYVAYPADGKTGDDCLLATKVMVPIDGEVREGVGLLGSPSFEIPRTVLRDRQFDGLSSGPEFRRRLAAKTRHNAVSMAAYLTVRWLYVLGVTVIALAAVDLYASLGAVAFAMASNLLLVLSVAYFVLVERAAGGFRALKPQYCSIYEPYFWWHERYWKLSTQPRILDGTPFKSLVWRLLGVRIGARVFDDGCVVMDKTLVSIGDDCVLNAGSIIQPHSQEDGAFKSDRIAIGSGCTVGVGALVHYGVTMGDGADLAPDSFLMKGEDVPPRSRWGGNPARENATPTTERTAP
jgi:non-ribosomal peptide synthetase-like protein